MGEAWEQGYALLVPLSDERYTVPSQLSGELQVVLDLGSSSQCESLNVSNSK